MLSPLLIIALSGQPNGVPWVGPQPSFTHGFAIKVLPTTIYSRPTTSLPEQRRDLSARGE